MSRPKLIFAVLIVAALFAFKAIFPAAAGSIIEKTETLFASDIDYREVLSGIGDSIAVFSEEEETGTAEGQATLVITPVETQHSGWSMAGLSAETGTNTGESAVLTEPEVPEAVAAFLESQKAYEGYALPENVSYEYAPFPGEYAVPVAGYSSSGFGYRLHPIHGEIRFHYGTDFAAWTGEEILSFAEGTVSFAGYCDSYGNYITIDHSDGWQSLYAHCSKLYVQTGDSVAAGQKIALVGETGLVTGPHLHFELTKDGIYANPEYYVN